MKTSIGSMMKQMSGSKPVVKKKPASFVANAKSAKNNARGKFIQRAKLYGKG